MSNITTTTIDYINIALANEVYKDDLLTFTGVATVLAGTILARDSVSLKLVPFVIGGVANGNGIPCAVLPTDVTSTGAGDVPVRAIIAGSVNRNRLVVNADGDGHNITKAIEDTLRARSIIPEVVDQISS
jgi:hypothetical protein